MTHSLKSKSNSASEIVNNAHHYKTTLSRRESLKWLGALSASAMLPSLTGCDNAPTMNEVKSANASGHWSEISIAPINAQGYGKDPNLIIPPKSPWPLTLSAKQLVLVAILSDILVPREGSVPSATEVNVPDVINEWVSAPYQRQQHDRMTILSTLLWIDDEAELRFNVPFDKITYQQQTAIIDDIAYTNREISDEFKQASRAFSRLRQLVLAAFFCSPEGTKDIGYQGNVPIMGDYPGPTDIAMEHLSRQLAKLKLTL